MRAVVDDPHLLALTGTSPSLVRRWAWTIGATFATLSGVLLAANLSLDPAALTLLVLQSFGAAAIGGFSNLPLTWVGGLVIGVATSLATGYLSSTGILGGFSASIPFIVLILVLVLVPKGYLPLPRAPREQRPARPRVQARYQVPFAVIVGVVLLLGPQIAGTHLDEWTSGLTNVMVLLSLGFLVRVSGQVSLAQLGFAAIGAAAFGNLMPHLGVPWLVMLILAGLVVVPIGALLALPATRLSGLYLALATLGFGIVLQDMFYQSNLMFTFGGAGLLINRPSLSWLSVGSDTGFYYLVLALTAVTAIALLLINRARVGRLLKALGEAPIALQAGGMSVLRLRIAAFCVATFIAGIAGALSGGVVGLVDGTNFDPLTSLTFVVVVVVTLGGQPWYALTGGMALALIPAYLTYGNVSYYLAASFGLTAIVVSVAGQPRPPRFLLRMLKQPTDAPARDSTLAIKRERPAVTPTSGVALEVRGLTVDFGGLRAVDGLSLKAAADSITGLIGPNGAGKTTTFNCCTGFVRPSAGDVLFQGKSIEKLSPAQRAQRGVGRTFQQVQLYEALSVYENVLLGADAIMAGSHMFGTLASRRGDGERARERAAEAIEMCGLQALTGRTVASISTGHRRLVEVARCLAADFKFVLLDEPSAGLDRSETSDLAALLRHVTAQWHVGILLVEHDIQLVGDVCSSLYVMDFGRLIAQGDPTTVLASEEVRRAYLGDVAVAAEATT